MTIDAIGFCWVYTQDNNCKAKQYMEVSKKGVPPNGWLNIENPIEVDDYPYFGKPPNAICHHKYGYTANMENGDVSENMMI